MNLLNILWQTFVLSDLIETGAALLCTAFINCYHAIKIMCLKYFIDFSRMDRIPANPLKTLHFADFEDFYWMQVKKLKDQKREIYKLAQVIVRVSFLIFARVVFMAAIFTAAWFDWMTRNTECLSEPYFLT